MLIMGERLCVTIKLVEPTTAGANPDDPLPACVKGAHSIMTQTVGVVNDGAKMVKGLSPAIKHANAAICGYPEHSLLILMNPVGIITAQAVWIGGVISIPSKGLCFSIESIQSSPGAHPEPTGPVFINRVDTIVAERLRIGGIMLITGEPDLFTIEFAESACRADPEVAQTILND